ncbi:F-box protein At1g67340-like [Oryza brachyantha]|uniref:F-box protein At1g67340-like n=1 Tax=Oryza brachyantha TaxID=4533 RepID=UPI001ADC9567|nr:F-box protein At1g67340-like [Oryza brachyantha]
MSRDEEGNGAEKRRRTGVDGVGGGGGGGITGAFDMLPDELVVSILADVAASAGSPADLAAAMLTCRRFREAGWNRLVLARASAACVAVRAGSWCNEARRFLVRCAQAGNAESSYLLGMIMFYCFENRKLGAELLGAAARRGHVEALYSMAIIQFNGSGLAKDGRNLQAGAHLCARAASRGHTDALRELGHCLSDGYGVRRSVTGGRRLLVQANFRELCAAVAQGGARFAAALGLSGECKPLGPHTCLLSDYGCHVAGAAGRRGHAANAFLAEWYASRPLALVPGAAAAAALRLCSQPTCGRPETRKHEFRRCSVCSAVIYCSRACQALHWKVAHKKECVPMEFWLDAANANGNAVGAVEAAAPAAAAAAQMAMP